MDAVVLFVHGLGSSCQETWGHMKEMFELDCELNQNFSIVFFDYDSSKISLFCKDGVTSLALMLKTRIDSLAAKYKTICVCAHSMGGLVVEKYISDCKICNIENRISKYACFATPHEGSGIAKVVSKVQGSNFALSDLSRGSGFIIDLARCWSAYRLDAFVDSIYFIGENDCYVDYINAVRSWTNEPYKCTGKGHFSITKPDGTDDEVYVLLKNFILSSSLGINIESFFSKNLEHIEELSARILFNCHVSNSILTNLWNDFLNETKTKDRIIDLFDVIVGELKSVDSDACSLIRNAMEFRKNWDEKLSSIVKYIKVSNFIDASFELMEALRHYYDDLKLASGRYSIEKFRDSLVMLKTEVNYPLYRKAFMLSGDLGVGKTHFALRAHLEARRKTSPVWVSSSLGVCEGVTGSPGDIERAVDFINDINEHAIKSDSYVIIIFDDIDSGVDRSCEFLIKLIVRCIDFDNIYFVITCDTYSMPDYIKHGSFESFSSHSSLYSRQSSGALDYINSGWIDCDAINAKEKIGGKIINGSSWIADSSKSDLLESLSGDDLYFMDRPLVAVLVLNAFSQDPGGSMLGLRYSGLAEAYYGNVISAYRFTPAEQDKFFKVVMLISEAASRSKSVSLLRHYVFGKHDSGDCENSKYLTALESSCLLLSSRARFMNSIKLTSFGKFQLRGLFFWSYFMLVIFDENDINEMIFSPEYFIKHVKNESLRPYMLQHIMLSHFDSQESFISANKVKKKWRRLYKLYSEFGYGYIILRSLLSYDLEFQSILFSKCVNDHSTHDRINIFAILKYILTCSSSAFDKKSRLFAISGHIKSILENDVESYFYDAFCDNVNSVDSVEDLYNLIDLLVPVYKKELSESVSLTLVRLISIKFKKNIYDFFEYIVRRQYDDYRECKSDSKWDRVHFLECFLLDITSAYLDAHGFDAIKDVVNHELYAHGDNSGWTKACRREINIAISSYIRREDDDKEMQKIKKLLQIMLNGNKIDVENVFFILYHVVSRPWHAVEAYVALGIKDIIETCCQKDNSLKRLFPDDNINRIEDIISSSNDSY